MKKLSTFWRDIKIVIRAVWINLLLFLVLLVISSLLLYWSGSYPQASALDLLVDAFHMAFTERVVEPGDGIIPALLTFIMPLLSVFILGEGILRILSVFIARGKNREEWDKMVAKTFSNHIVICGIGELGKALVKRIHTDHPEDNIVLVDLRSGLLAELGFNGENIICIQSDMTALETLKKTNCDRAKLILLTSGNDAVNLEAAYKVQQLNPNMETWVRLHHSGLADLMDLARKPNLHFFSPYLQAAEVIASHLLDQ